MYRYKKYERYKKYIKCLRYSGQAKLKIALDLAAKPDPIALA
jgi:hypothetical protein